MKEYSQGYYTTQKEEKRTMSFIKHHRNKVILLTIMVVVVLVCILASQELPTKEVLYTSQSAMPIGEVADDTVICQSFHANHDIIKINLLAATYGSTEQTGMLLAELKSADTNQILGAATYDIASIADNSFIALDFGKTLHTKGRDIVLELTASGTNEHKITFWASASAVEGMELTVNETDLTGNIVFSVVTLNIVKVLLKVLASLALGMVLFRTYYCNRKNVIVNNRFEQFYTRLDQWLSIKKVAFIVASMLCIAVVFEFNFSSMEQYKLTIPNNIAEVSNILLGKSRPIRSDEYLGLWRVFQRLHQPNLGLNGIPETIFFFASLKNIMFYILPAANAFSFYSLFPYFFSFFFIYLFFKIFILDRNIFPLIASLIITLSPEYVWWWGPVFVGKILAIVSMFYFFFHTERVKYKILCAIGLALTLSWVVAEIYPAWDIPYAYVGLFLTIAIFWKNDTVKFRKTDVIYILCVIAWVGVVSCCYYITQADAIAAQLATVYPGQRFCTGGGLSPQYLFHYLLMPLAPTQDIAFLNNAEVSSSLTLFPLPIIMFLLNWKQFSKHRIIVVLQGLALACLVYMFVGYPDGFTKITLMGYTMPARLSTIFNFIGTLLLLFECYYYQPQLENSEKLLKKINVYALNICMAGSYLCLLHPNLQIVSTMGMTKFIIVVVVCLAMSNFLIRGRKRTFIAYMLMTSVWCGAMVNPINKGVDIMMGTQLATQIQEIDKDDEGRWLVVGDMVLPKYVAAQGVDCVNALSYPPRFDLFYPIDPTKQYEDIYNRYAHVTVHLTNEEASAFTLEGMDHIGVALSVSDIDLWNVKYIATKSEIQIDTDELNTTQIYRDPLDGVNIYKVTYK